MRELRGAWPLAAPGLDPKALSCARHLGVIGARVGDPLDRVRSLAAACAVDPRDLEGALVRCALGHRGHLRPCPGGRACVALAPAPTHAPASPTTTVSTSVGP